MKQKRLLVFLCLLATVASADYTTNSAGGEGGGPFTLNCPADMAMVGIHGKAGAYIDRIGITCVKVYSNGTWAGDPVQQTDLGGAGGSPYESLCPRNEAVSVIVGRSSNFVDQLQIGCSGLTSNGRLSGYPTMRPEVIGGTGGNPFGPSGFNCYESRPGKGFTGRYGAWVDKIALVCEYPQTQVMIPAAPTIVSPANNADIYHHEVRLDWNAVSGATRYEVCLTRNATLECGNNSNSKYWNNLTATELTIAPGDLQGFFGRTLKWGVKACNSAGCGVNTNDIRSLWVRFPPAALSSPANNTNLTTRRPTFQWTAVSEADGYEIGISTPTDPWGARQIFAVSGGTTSQYTPTVDVASTGSTGFYWSVRVCKPTTSCGFSGKAAEGTQRWAYYPTSTNALTWTTQLSQANAGLTGGATLASHLTGKKLADIVNSQTTGRGDGRLCNECHKAATVDAGLATFYRPGSETGITPTDMWIYKCRTSAIGSTATSVTCKWKYGLVANAPSLVQNFCQWVGRSPANKPQDLCDILTKWASDGYLP